jgi:putative ABC transport system permease protein
MIQTHFGPIVRALLKSRLGAALIVLQIALTLAIVANMLPVVSAKISASRRASGVQDAQLFWLSAISTLESKAARNDDLAARTARELATIQAVPGVANASFTNTVPNSNSGWTTSVSIGTKGGEADAGIYASDGRTFETLGVRIVKGRNFDAREITDANEGVEIDPEQIILTEAMAKRLFPDTEAIGKRVSMHPPFNDVKSQVIGIVSDVARPWPDWGNYYDAVYIPYRMPGYAHWIVRVKAGFDPDQVSLAVKSALEKSAQNMIYGTKMSSFKNTRSEAYASSLLIAGLLGSFSAMVLAITLLGIVGLASFWITQRTRQIGVRRALGAKASDIVRYFREENFVLSSVGALLGVLLAYALNFMLSKHLDAPALQWHWVMGSALVLIALGQFAVSAPAKRAAKIAPALATRS